MRLDHLLSKEEQVQRCVLLFSYQVMPEKDRKPERRKGMEIRHRLVSFKNWITTAGGDALRGHTRSHPEHDG